MDSSNASSTSESLEQVIQSRVQGLLFMGWYTKRIWVQELAGYRDALQPDPTETQAIKVFKSMIRRCKKDTVYPALQREQCGGAAFILEPFPIYIFFFSLVLCFVVRGRRRRRNRLLVRGLAVWQPTPLWPLLVPGPKCRPVTAGSPHLARQSGQVGWHCTQM